MKNVYSKSWSRKRKQYGIKQYDKDLIHELSRTVKNGKILDVGIGDGFPYSIELDEMGYEVYGIDISPTHVDMVKESLPNINVKLGDAEYLEFEDNFFDAVFCFRSTWYFPNVIKVIREMLRIVNKNGIVMFDIQNLKHPIHIASAKKMLKQSNKSILFLYPLQFIKNIVKLLLRPFKFIPTNWSFNKIPVFSTPTNPNDLIRYFQRKNDVKIEIYGVDWNNEISLVPLKPNQNFSQFDRLVYKIVKTPL